MKEQQPMRADVNVGTKQGSEKKNKKKLKTKLKKSFAVSVDRALALPTTTWEKKKRVGKRMHLFK